MNKKRIFLLLILILSFSMIIGGCSARKSQSYDMTPQENATSETSMDMDYSENKAMDDYAMKEEMSEERGYDMVEPDKIITTVNISMQTKEFTETTEKLIGLITKYKGYIENSNISHNNYINSARLKYSEYTIRIPRENLNQFVNELKEIGNIISENTSKQDITKQYRDTESRLKVLETKEGRILALLEKAEKMEDIITLENQLSNIIYEKESLTANIMDMDDKVDYSTVYFQLDEVAKLNIGENVKTPFWTKVANAFKDSIYFFTNNIENLIISLIYFLPYALIIAVVLYILYRIKKKFKHKTPKE